MADTDFNRIFFDVVICFLEEFLYYICPLCRPNRKRKEISATQKKKYKCVSKERDWVLTQLFYFCVTSNDVKLRNLQTKN